MGTLRLRNFLMTGWNDAWMVLEYCSLNHFVGSRDAAAPLMSQTQRRRRTVPQGSRKTLVSEEEGDLCTAVQPLRLEPRPGSRGAASQPAGG